MIGIDNLWLFVAAGLLLNVTPGPDFALVMGRSLQMGVRGGIAAALGVGAGALVHILAAALGLSAVLATSATAFTIVKLAGAAYLVWIGARMLLSRAAPGREEAATPAPATLRAVFLQGMLTNVLNPKVALFFLAFLPQFIAPDAPSKTAAFITLGLIFNTTGTLWNLAVAWLAARMSAVLGAGTSLRIGLDRVLGAMFVALGARLAVLQRTP